MTQWLRDRVPTRSTRNVGIGGVLGAAALWAFWPLPAPVADMPAPPPSAAVAPAPPPAIIARAAFDEGAFRVPIWVAPPAPPQPAPAVPPPPPLRLHLLAITEEGGIRRAVLYDADSDRLHVVKDGEPLGSRVVEHVLASGVSLREGQSVRTISLELPPRFTGGVP